MDLLKKLYQQENKRRIKALEKEIQDRKKHPEKYKCPDGTAHDWETISKGKIWRYYRYDYCKKDIFKTNNYVTKDRPIEPLGYSQWAQATNRVCVKCGQCDNQEARWKKALREQTKADRRRKAWAKQLWEDGCKETSQ